MMRFTQKSTLYRWQNARLALSLTPLVALIALLASNTALKQLQPPFLWDGKTPYRYYQSLS